MHDVECPYCGTELNICHDDGHCYEEDVPHEESCHNCYKNFVFFTTITFSYDGHKADCLNGSEHIFKSSWTCPKEFTMMECRDCGETRKPTEEEWVKILK